MPPPRLILASASPRRRDLLNEAGYDFEIIPSPAEEIHDASMTPPDLTEENARRKAEAIAETVSDAVVVGADTLVFIDDTPIGKPRDFADATRMLGQLNGRTHQVCTGVCLSGGPVGESRCFHALTAVTFRNLNPAEIEAYLRKIDPLDKAGAYAAQEHGSLIIAKTEGSWTNVVGLPMEKFQAELARLEVHPTPTH